MFNLLTKVFGLKTGYIDVFIDQDCHAVTEEVTRIIMRYHAKSYVLVDCNKVHIKVEVFNYKKADMVCELFRIGSYYALNNSELAIIF